jgi:2-polyprenyl-3-methyl-5-hydroxy-6-metoxy-1,4-benzoquinol methylase
MKTAQKTQDNLTDVSTHFAFGRNWASYANIVGEEQIAKAVESLARLIKPEEITGKSFLDIGCGSGLSMLAALRLGAKLVTGIDIDPDSAATAKKLLGQQAQGIWAVEQKSVFDLDPAKEGQFDIVHSWGVLHHTGNLDRAIENAARLVAPGGLFVLALYSKTPMCGFWTKEKKLYTNTSPFIQAFMRGVYKIAYMAGLLATRRNPASYIKNYTTHRGMDWSHDVHDWLGGYPYESVTPDEVQNILSKVGFVPVRSFTKTARAYGFFGTHCDEFVARKAG